MKKVMTYSVLALLFVSVALLTCSNNKEAESESEKGTIEKMNVVTTAVLMQ